ncbi:MAG TPA: ATP-binding protein [Roseiflexaceae bacterium]|nr:ATP-binding protein [Roseiflexaceae bacterium]
MTAGDLLVARARPWVTGHRAELMRAIAPLPGIGMAWWLSVSALPPVVWSGLLAYSLVQLALIALDRRGQARTTAIGQLAIGWSSILADVLLSLLLISQAQALGAAIFPLYILVALRVLAGYAQAPIGTITPFMLGPTYLFSLHVSHYQPLAEVGQVGGWGLLLGSLSFGAAAIWAGASEQRQNDALRQQLRAERQSREARVEELERITNELRARMRERHALEEGLRVITSTLSLDEVLTQIVDSTVHTFGQERIHGMALSLRLDGVMKHHTFAATIGDIGWAEALARRVIQQQVPVIAADAALDAEMADLARHGMRSVLSVPLFVGGGPPRGALTVVSATFAAFSSSDARHLAAFAAQAGIAIANAELHSRLHRQQRLLEAVMRDINDGLVVMDGGGRVVLANPIGQRLLEATAAGSPVRERLAQLAAAIRAESSNSSAASELTIDSPDGDEETGRFFQAFVSAVHRDDGSEPLAAIVLHDITSQKAEEQARVEFISMVSHELRNPLHSLNGFVKVVLQGRAGALTPLQQDFLQMADGQIEQLKGRIAELLEFNRLRAGRLSLNPQWSDLGLLVTGTLNRLRLQAEERGLTLAGQVQEPLPECWCDSARIGQVLTNLVENAIKATPPGGTITVNSETHEAEVWIRVRDTGVGIPASELGKIFQRFYRVAKHTSGPDNHLGLGLAICQQIVEGHGGRMWVESEEGVGTCFTFALPLQPAAAPVGLALMEER